mmetsp:Transcript_18654/g.28064  ORF Transcript_18654/g.28064 Transcript_18654/m.28064 type:complete len:165 (-) Transcript_18654:165-659(-)
MPKTPTSTDRPTEDTTWDGSPLTRYAWQKDLPRRLTRANPSYRTLCEYGYVLERSKVVCSSPSHRDNLFHNNVARSTFQNPCAIDQFTQINNKLTLTAVPAESAPRYVIAPEILWQRTLVAAPPHEGTLRAVARDRRLGGWRNRQLATGRNHFPNRLRLRRLPR